jgi:hypothetical protein
VDGEEKYDRLKPNAVQIRTGASDPWLVIVNEVKNLSRPNSRFFALLRMTMP